MLLRFLISLISSVVVVEVKYGAVWRRERYSGLYFGHKIAVIIKQCHITEAARK